MTAEDRTSTKSNRLAAWIPLLVGALAGSFIANILTNSKLNQHISRGHGSATGSFGIQDQDKTLRVVSGTSGQNAVVVLNDKNGKTRMRFEVDDATGLAIIALLDGEGKPRIRMAVTKDGKTLVDTPND